MAKVSVYVPCYNYGHYLQNAVQSALSQDGVDVEVLIIDDASTDNTQEVAAALTRDSRVEYIRHSRNLGNIATYNEGIEWATGDYAVLLSADDLLTRGSLRRAADLLDSSPSVNFAYGHAIWWHPERRTPKARERVRGWRIWSGEDWIRRRCVTGRSAIATVEAVTRTEAHRQFGGYNPDLRFSGDLELWLRLAAHGDVGYVRGADQAYYRIHSSSMWQTLDLVTSLRQDRLAFETAIGEQAYALRDPEGLLNAARRALTTQALERALWSRDLGVESGSAERLIEFAFETFSGAVALRQSRSVERRLGWSPGVRQFSQIEAVPRYKNRLRSEITHIRGT